MTPGGRGDKVPLDASTKGEGFQRGESRMDTARPKAYRFTNTPRTMACIGVVCAQQMG